jgi:hypothetical protein
LSQKKQQNKQEYKKLKTKWNEKLIGNLWGQRDIERGNNVTTLIEIGLMVGFIVKQVLLG